MDRAVHADIVLEQTLGHVTHAKNLQRLLPDVDGIEPRFRLVPFDVDGAMTHLPGWSNWTVRAGVRAHRLVRAGWRSDDGRPDVMFVHTQVPAILLQREMRRVPSVVSLDATPIQYDQLGESYAHARGPEAVERVKLRLNRRSLQIAAHVITWSEWAKRSVVDDYHIDAEKVTVIPAGVDTALWRRPTPRRAEAGPVSVLFVGGDLRRKGGDVLIQAVRRLRADPDLPEVELHLVTTADVDPEPGVQVHRGLTSNSPELIARYHAADVFCLPTLGDCLPMVLTEAAAAELPIVSTDVGAIADVVQPGVTGELVEPGDAEMLTASLRRLVADPDTRTAYGRAAAALATRDHDARRNAERIGEILRRAAGTDADSD